MITKLGIGTVQFGLDYGISNRNGKTTSSEASSILTLGRKSGILMLDTARAYGDSEQVLGSLGLEGFNIVSKFQSNTNGGSVRKDLETTLRHLKSDSIYAYMAHNADDLINYPQAWNDLRTLKNEGYIRKIGFSLYNPEQLETLWSMKMIPDIVQLPYNLLDRKFESFFPELKSTGTEIHVRSVFLQGLFFLKGDEVPVKIRTLNTSLSEIRQLSEQHGLAMESLALNFVIHNPEVDFVIVGVNEARQLESNIRSLLPSWDNTISEKIRTIKVTSPELLNPVNWK